MNMISTSRILWFSSNAGLILPSDRRVALYQIKSSCPPWSDQTGTWNRLNSLDWRYWSQIPCKPVSLLFLNVDLPVGWDSFNWVDVSVILMLAGAINIMDMNLVLALTILMLTDLMAVGSYRLPASLSCARSDHPDRWLLTRLEPLPWGHLERLHYLNDRRSKVPRNLRIFQYWAHRLTRLMNFRHRSASYLRCPSHQYNGHALGTLPWYSCSSPWWWSGSYRLPASHCLVPKPDHPDCWLRPGWN